MNRTEALVKVKALRMLADDTYVTVEMAADFFEVPADAIEWHIRRDREELNSDGLEVLTGPRLSAFKAESGYRSRAGSLTLITRRALLRLGMLLRDSEVAKQVRTQLLDGEARANQSRFDELDINDPNTVLILAQAAQKSAALAIEERNGRLAAEAQVAELEPKAHVLDAIEAGEGMPLRTYRKSYFPDIPEREFFTHLYRRGFLIDQRGTGPWDARTKKYRDGTQHGHPAALANPYLYLHSQLDRFEIRRHNTRVRPGEPEIKLRDLLVRQGLTPKLITDADLERTAR
ncbi:MAG: phage antirepressor KilAC domain-containing protein, partial [Actinoplanes sp.]